MTKASKLSEQLLRGCIIGRNSIIKFVKRTKMHTIASFADTDSPASCLPRDSFDTALTVAPHPLIRSVLPWFALPEIRPSIVKRVVIPMVTFLFPDTRKYLTMHIDHFIQTVGPPFSYGVERTNVWLPVSVPIPPTEPREVFGVNDGILPLRERNQAVGCINWLRNRVPLHTAFWHVVLHQRTLCNAAILS